MDNIIDILDFYILIKKRLKKVNWGNDLVMVHLVAYLKHFPSL